MLGEKGTRMKAQSGVVGWMKDENNLSRCNWEMENMLLSLCCTAASYEMPKLLLTSMVRHYKMTTYGDFPEILII